MSQIPKWAKWVMRHEDRDRIAQASMDAEKRSGVELIPVIVRRSSAVGHIGLTLGLLFLLALYFFRFVVPLSPDAAWQPWYTPLAEAVVAGCLGWGLSWSPRVQRYLTPRLDRNLAVQRRAYLEFYKHHAEETRTGVGILLFVSLMERRAVVLCGRGLSSKIPSQAWGEVHRLLIDGAEQRCLGDGFVRAIGKSAEVVLKHAPRLKKMRHPPLDRVAIKE